MADGRIIDRNDQRSTINDQRSTINDNNNKRTIAIIIRLLLASILGLVIVMVSNYEIENGQIIPAIPNRINNNVGDSDYGIKEEQYSTTATTSTITPSFTGNSIIDESNSNITVTVNDELLKSRLSELSLTDHKFSFVHISKCAGASWIIELLPLLPRFNPKAPMGQEFGVAYQKTIYYQEEIIQQNQNRDRGQDDNGVVKLLTSFKHPRAHVWSLWGECVFDTLWKGHEKLPYNSNMTYEYNFESWLNHFLWKDNNTMQYSYHKRNITKSSSTTTSSSEESSSSSYNEFQIHDYDCYHPANFQSRFLSSPASVQKPQHVTELPNNDQYKFEPNIDQVRLTRHNELAWISISEFFHESKCLLYHRLYKSIHASFNNNSNSNNVTDILYNNIRESTTKEAPPKTISRIESKIKSAIKTITNYIETYCRCNDNDNDNPASSSSTTATTKDDDGNDNDEPPVYRISHHKEGKRTTFMDLPQSLIEKLDWFIRIDTINYRESLIEFLLEMATLEKELNRPVLCNTTIIKWENELSYIGLPDKLSNVYKWARNYVGQQQQQQ